jgi:hypothetical protein
VGHKFTLILNREISADETGVLKASGCRDASVTSVPVPGDADTTVTQMDFDTEATSSLAEAIQAALDAVKKFPDLSVPTLHVPAQPSTAAPAEDEGRATDPGVVSGGLEEIKTAEAEQSGSDA